MYAFTFGSTYTASTARRNSSRSSGGQDRVDVGSRGQAAHAVEDRQFVAAVGVVDDDLEHEAIDLRFGQGIGSFLLDRVLRRQDEERSRQRVRRLADGDLPLGHRLEQRALHLRRRAVDLVGQDDVGEHRPLLHREFAGSRVVDLRADDVGGQQVGRELDALELQVQSAGHGADGERLRQPRHAFEEHVPVGEQADEEAVDEVPLADQDALDRAVERVEFRPQLLDDRRGRSWLPRGANNLMIQTRRERVRL